MKLQAVRALGALAMVAGLVWIALRLPAYPGDGLIALACSGLVVAVIGHVVIGMRRIHKTNEGARGVLAKRDFLATHAFQSWKGDALIAVDAAKRIAICELGKDGVVLVVRIATPAELAVEAREGAGLLDEHRPPPDESNGVLTLHITHKKRAYPVVICEQFPRLSGSRNPDLDEYQKIRVVAAWWRDTLSGREPVQPYVFSSQLSLHASGPDVDAASEAVTRKLLGDELPRARIVERD